MRILHVITRLNVGGPARHVLLMGELLAQRGHLPLIVHGIEDPGEGSLADALAAGQTRHVRVPTMRRPVRWWSDVRALGHLVWLMRHERPDVVHTHTAKAGALGRLAAGLYNLTRRRSRRCTVVHTFHGHVFSGYFPAAGSAAVRTAERLLARRTDRIITISARQHRDLVDRYRIAPAAKVVTIEIGTDLDPLLRLQENTTLRERCGFDAGHVVFGYAGRLAPIKALPLLVQAFARAADRLPPARLLIVGDGAEREAVEREVARFGVADRVVMPGWVRDVKAIYGAMDVCVLSSINEGTPLALLEAMAAARPVVATGVGGVEDIVRHGQTGLVVPPNDAVALAEAMVRLGGDSRLRRQWGLAARRAVATRFDPERVAADIVELYRCALAERRAMGPSRRADRSAAAAAAAPVPGASPAGRQRSGPPA